MGRYRPRRVKVVTDYDTRLTKGIAYVEFGTMQAAEAAQEGLHGAALGHLIIQAAWKTEEAVMDQERGTVVRTRGGAAP